MDIREKGYRTVTNFIGVSLLIFLVIFNVTNVAVTLVSDFFKELFPYDIAYSIEQTLLIVSYLSSFVIPAIILRAMLARRGISQDMRLYFNMSAIDYLLVPAGIMLTFSASYLNSILLSWLDISDIYSSLINAEQAYYAPYQIVLLVVSTALVPAFCEEFFFRGTILSSLLPYGQGVAIIGSAILFGLMHQNPYQLLYATVAGILLGFVYVKTRSIWCGTIIHFLNNSFSVIEQIIYTNCEESFANVLIPIIDVSMIAIGFISLALYFIFDGRRQKRKFRDGSFGVLVEKGEAYEQIAISPSRKLKSFFTPWMIVAVVVLAVSVVSTLFMLIFVSGIGALI